MGGLPPSSRPAKDSRGSCFFRRLLVLVSWALLPQGLWELTPLSLDSDLSLKKPPHLLSQKASVSLLASKVPDGLSQHPRVPGTSPVVKRLGICLLIYGARVEPGRGIKITHDAGQLNRWAATIEAHVL